MVISSLADVRSLINTDVAEYEEDIYDTTEIDLDCLLPTGIYIRISVDRWVTVKAVKKLLWKEAQDYPLANDLKDPSTYRFVHINSLGEREEIQNEDQEISTIQPFMSVLKVIQREKQTNERELSNKVGSLIGKFDFESMRDEEIIAFRSSTKKLCEEVNHHKHSIRDLNDLISFSYPPDICQDVEIWQRVSQALENHNNRLFIEILHDHSGTTGTHRLLISAEQYPEDVINQALRKQRQVNIPGQTPSNLDFNDYVLKIVGREEYLIPDGQKRCRPLYKYTYIYRKIMKGESPKLAVVKKTDVIKPVARPRRQSTQPPVLPRGTMKKLPRDVHANLWDIRAKYKLEVKGAKQLGCDADTSVQIKAGMYHGVEPICDLKDTYEVQVIDGMVEFDQTLEFDIAVCDLPRMSRLCLAIYAGKGSKKANQRKAGVKPGNKPPPKRTKKYSESGYVDVTLKKEQIPLAWVNICVFDFKARLTVGNVRLNMWAFDDTIMLSEESLVHYLGTVVDNPNKDGTIALDLKFSRYGKTDRPIVYPSEDQVLKYVADTASKDQEYGSIGRFSVTEEEAKAQLHELLDDRDPLQEFHENEKEQIWGMRVDIRDQYTNSLPKLLTCVRWNSHDDVAQMHVLLQTWPPVDQDTALELLDCLYPDKNVRDFAIKCLKQSISDTELRIYLLQLVQALKFENYLECQLVYFLIERALYNRKLGHYLFWHLKSEMQGKAVSVRFGLILEAYLSGSVDHVSVLTQQADTIGKLKSVTTLVKNQHSREQGIKHMREVLDNYTKSQTFYSVSSPLNPALKLSLLRVPNCKYMDSKMKPLWLEWENGDKFGEDIKIIFKNGDDLRQDMLTLQVLQIMDNIWISQGKDLRISPYECISTGRDIGMLEVVQHANTIANIQKTYSSGFKSAFNKESIYRWLCEKNPEKAQLEKALHEFTLSCAGYCVASYVLGIADRHSDNIMIKETGQMFHIDFGHILGNVKYKFGIRRERVPFILTNDFIFIIMKGPVRDNKKPFDYFKQLCVDAYLLLRKKGNLLISLFMMMLSTGLSELKTVKDLKYLQETLKLDVSEAEASKHFRSKIKEALNNAWTTSVNWGFHNAVRNN